MLHTLGKLLIVALTLASCSSSASVVGERVTAPSASPPPPPTAAAAAQPTPNPSAATATTTPIAAAQSEAAAPSGDGVEGRSADVAAYQGLGAWLDVWDYSPTYANNGVPAVGPEVIDDMAAAGVQTLYLQTVRRDDRTTALTEDPALLAEFISRAHSQDIAVVGWYLPTWDGPEQEDLDRLLAILDFDVDGQQFDGVGVDIEGVPEPAERNDWNDRLVSLSTDLRAAAGDRAISAIVLPPILIEEINDEYWPDFPWEQLGPLYDAWLPMTYWSFRKPDSPWAGSGRYAADSVEKLRVNINDPDAIVHVIGGIGLDNEDSETGEPIARVDDLPAFVEAANATNSVGWSIYDWLTISSDGLQLMTELASQ